MLFASPPAARIRGEHLVPLRAKHVDVGCAMMGERRVGRGGEGSKGKEMVKFD